MNDQTKAWDASFREELLKANDFRSFLRPFFTARSSRTAASFRKPKPMTFAAFSKKAGLSSRSYILDILEKRKPLGPTVTEKICRALGLNALWKKYFTLLVAVSKSEDPELEAKLSFIRKKIIKRGRIVRVPPQGKGGKLAGILIPNLPQIYAACGSEDNGASLAEISLRTRIPESKACEALSLLQSLDLIEERKERYYPRYAHLAFEKFGGEDYFRQDYQNTLGRTGKRFRESTPSENWLFFASTVCVRKDRMAEFSAQLRDLLHNFVSDSEDPDGNSISDLVLGFTDNTHD